MPKPIPDSQTTSSRKERHVELCLTEDVNFKKTNGFERYTFPHNAAPEINFKDIDINTEFLGHVLSMPLMVSSMTGGYSGATQINTILAEACESLQIALGVGSMRQALESESNRESFTIVRKIAPSIPIFANIGASEIAAGLPIAKVLSLLSFISANGLIIHLNPVQELFQPEGNTNFKGFLNHLKNICRELSVPVLVKEVGNGISASVAQRLFDVGVQAIDVAGAGGTNWQKIEEIRYQESNQEEQRFTKAGLEELLNWGIPTAECLEDLRVLKASSAAYEKMLVVASGGITTGVEIAKSIALGATIAGIAKPFLQAANETNGKERVINVANTLANELKSVMFLIGASNLVELMRSPLKKINE